MELSKSYFYGHETRKLTMFDLYIYIYILRIIFFKKPCRHYTITNWIACSTPSVEPPHDVLEDMVVDHLAHVQHEPTIFLLYYLLIFKNFIYPPPPPSCKFRITKSPWEKNEKTHAKCLWFFFFQGNYLEKSKKTMNPLFFFKNTIQPLEKIIVPLSFLFPGCHCGVKKYYYIITIHIIMYLPL
jgi:hypothetical protein